MIIDGKALAAERREEIAKERALLGPLSLGVVIATTDTVTASYVGIKKRAAEALGISVIEYRLKDDAPTETIIAAVGEASHHDGLILQLPLPKGADTERARNAIPLDRDVDVLGDAAFERFAQGFFPPTPPVPAAMLYVLKRNGVSVKGKTVVMLGMGRLVGKPAEILFYHLDANTRTLIKGDDVPAVTRGADIIVSGAGVPHLLKPDMVKDGVVILDAGASELGGKLVGDADPACAEKA
ncbi:MAG: bifunctional 5,10-methylenetetrahydrofolate dehydrogenase/5,10-methenyltetrahydrofolate cyclohydrolase, partial [Patescibacteria group bacterium]